MPKVKERTGLSRSTIYAKIAQGTFPKPVCLGARAVGWLESEIDEWINSLSGGGGLLAWRPRDSIAASSGNSPTRF